MNKWIYLVFSTNTLIPENNDRKGYAGLKHVEEGYLYPLIKIGNILCRKIVLPYPRLCLSRKHNNYRKITCTNWNDYIDITPYNIDSNPPFEINDDYSIKTSYSYKYFNSNTDINVLKNHYDIDILILSNYNNPDINLEVSSYLHYPNKGYSNMFDISSSLKTYANDILTKYELYNYIFIHIRRGDTLYGGYAHITNGTHKYTTPAYIYSYIKEVEKREKLNTNYKIVVATNETSPAYIINLKQLFTDGVYDNRLYIESDIIKELPTDITNNNYKIYQIMNHIANKSCINIITLKLRIGNKYAYRLSEQFT